MIERALIIGAGIAGIQAALDIANSGHEVVLVEKDPSIGGHMAQLSETFPTLDCSQCIMTPRTVEVGHHDNIRLDAGVFVCKYLSRPSKPRLYLIYNEDNPMFLADLLYSGQEICGWGHISALTKYRFDKDSRSLLRGGLGDQ